MVFILILMYDGNRDRLLYIWKRSKWKGNSTVFAGVILHWIWVYLAEFSIILLKKTAISWKFSNFIKS